MLTNWSQMIPTEKREQWRNEAEIFDREA